MIYDLGVTNKLRLLGSTLLNWKLLGHNGVMVNLEHHPGALESKLACFGGGGG